MLAPANSSQRESPTSFETCDDLPTRAPYKKNSCRMISRGNSKLHASTMIPDSDFVRLTVKEANSGLPTKVLPSISRRKSIRSARIRASSHRDRRRRQGPPLLYIRWFALMAVIALARTIWSFISITQERNIPQKTLMDFINLGKSPLPGVTGPSIWMWQRSTARQRRPPNSTFLDQDLASLQPTLSVSNTQVLSPYEINATETPKILCGNQINSRHPIQSTSRVLIYGLLSHPLGLDLAMTLAKTCGVEAIVGMVDTDFDIESLPRLAYLIRHIPGFQFFQTTTITSEKRWNELLVTLEPSHIVNLESISFSSSIRRRKSTAMFAIRGSIEKLERLQKAVVRYQARRNDRPHLVYVTVINNSYDFLSKAVRSIYPRILYTFRSLYDVHSTHLSLPEIYGPFSEGSQWMDGDFVMKNATDIGFPDDKALIYIKDCVKQVITCMVQTKHDIPRSDTSTLVIDKSQTTTLRDLSKTMVSLRSASRETFLRGNEFDALRNMLSWLQKRQSPYGHANIQEESLVSLIGSAVGFTNANLSFNNTEGISTLQRRQNYLFPCVSECGKLIPCVKKSAFNSVVRVSRRTTENCSFVLYVSDFSKHLDDLPEWPENFENRTSPPWPRDTMCQVAFVSGKSSLVKSLVAKMASCDSQGISCWNGSLRHKGWTVVWLENESSGTMSEADYMMPKLAPGTLFSDKVKRAVYIEPDRMISLPPLLLLWYLMAKQLDFGRMPSEKSEHQGATDNYSTTRHVSLLINKFPMKKPLLETNSFVELENYVLEQKGLEGTYQVQPRLQLQFYDHVKKLSSGGFTFELMDTFVIVHLFHSSQSRRVRCEWYEEHLFWSDRDNNNNRNLEEMSLAYVISKWRNEQRIVMPDSSKEWGEQIHDPLPKEVFLLHSSGTKKDGKKTSGKTPFYVQIQEPMAARKIYPSRYDEI